jgi:hypothetical protein
MPHISEVNEIPSLMAMSGRRSSENEAPELKLSCIKQLSYGPLTNSTSILPRNQLKEQDFKLQNIIEQHL